MTNCYINTWVSICEVHTMLTFMYSRSPRGIKAFRLHYPETWSLSSCLWQAYIITPTTLNMAKFWWKHLSHKKNGRYSLCLVIWITAFHEKSLLIWREVEGNNVFYTKRPCSCNTVYLHVHFLLSQVTYKTCFPVPYILFMFEAQRQLLLW